MRNMETNLLAAAYSALENKVEASDPEVHTALTMARAYKGNCADIVKLGQHESRAQRDYQRALDDLRTLQSERRAAEAAELQTAINIRNMQKSKGEQWNPADDGFVLTIAEIDAHYRRQCLVQASLHYAKNGRLAA